MATALDVLDPINVTTRRYIQETPELVDNIYNQDPFTAYLRANLVSEWTGGSSINRDFLGKPMPGGAYSKGQTLDVSQRQTEFQARFDMKLDQVAITLFQEDIEVFNVGPLAVINLAKSRVAQSYLTMGAHVGLAAYLPTNTTNYAKNITGLAEALNDGSGQSWNGQSYATYGGLTRATFGNSLKTVPVNLAGADISNDILDSGYMDAFFGSGMYEPNLGITTPRGFTAIRTKYQSLQRFQETQDGKFNFTGMKFLSAVILASRYCPGSYINSGQTSSQDDVAVDYLTHTTDGAVVTYPVGNLSTNLESLFFLNARKPYLEYYVAKGRFGGGLREFIPTANNTVLTAFVLLSHQMVMWPKYHKQIYGFKA